MNLSLIRGWRLFNWSDPPAEFDLDGPLLLGHVEPPARKAETDHTASRAVRVNTSQCCSRRSKQSARLALLSTEDVFSQAMSVCCTAGGGRRNIDTTTQRAVLR
jgi:hypothetical protein